MAMIRALVWGGHKTGATITGCAQDRADRQVMYRIVETGGRCCLPVDSRIGCSRQKAAPAGMPFGNRWAAARHAPVLDFRIDRLSSGRHGESGFGKGKDGGGRKLGSKFRQAGSCEKAWPSGVGTGTVAGWNGIRTGAAVGSFRDTADDDSNNAQLPGKSVRPSRALARSGDPEIPIVPARLARLGTLPNHY